MSTRSPIAWLRNPAYTGANRCRPCTVVNLLLVAVGAVLSGFLLPIAGAVVAVLGVGAVWLRGYVVPGTPTLTRRYLPEGVRALFGKDSIRTAETPPEGDPTEQLATLGVIDEDSTLRPAFRAAWRETATDLTADEETLRWAAGETLSVDPDSVAVTCPENGGVALTVDGDWTGDWPSRTALIADLATESVLVGEAWTGLSRVRRADLSARIRGLADTCPVCGTTTRVLDETVLSCCASTDVVAVDCPTCASRLAEFDPAPAAFAPGQ